MKMHDKCLPCIVNQIVKVAAITNVPVKEELYKDAFAYLSNIDYDTTTPEIIGDIFAMIKKYTKNPDLV